MGELDLYEDGCLITVQVTGHPLTHSRMTPGFIAGVRQPFTGQRLVPRSLRSPTESMLNPGICLSRKSVPADPIQCGSYTVALDHLTVRSCVSLL